MMESEHPVVSALCRTGLPPGAQDAPRCPHCGAECEDYFYNVWGEFCGCDVCLTRRDAWQARAASGF